MSVALVCFRLVDRGTCRGAADPTFLRACSALARTRVAKPWCAVEDCVEIYASVRC